MASRVSFFLVLALYLTTGQIPGRYELTNPDLEVTSSAGRTAAKRAWTVPRA